MNANIAIRRIKMLMNNFEDVPDFKEFYFESLEKAIDVLDKEIHPRRKPGKWIRCGNRYVCSKCDEFCFSVWDDTNCEEIDVLTDFCPHCGNRNIKEESIEE